jgi:ankyrin repeat protein
MVSQHLYEAVEKGHLDGVKRLLKENADPNWVHPTLGMTSLHQACIKGFATIVKCLLLNGADPNKLDNSHRTSLFCICHYLADTRQNREILQLLLDFGADPNVCLHGECALWYVSRQPWAVSKLLSAGTTLNAPTTPHAEHFSLVQKMFHICASEESIKFTLCSGFDVTMQYHGDTCLHTACNHDSIPTIKMMLVLGADPGAKNEFGFTPADYAKSPLAKQLLATPLDDPIFRSTVREARKTGSRLRGGLRNVALSLLAASYTLHGINSPLNSLHMGFLAQEITQLLLDSTIL